MTDYTGGSEPLGTVHPNQEKLISQISSFLSEVENLTPGKSLEDHLNKSYGPGTPHYDTLAGLIKSGLEEGWVANIPIDGQRYRRSRVSPPTEATRFCSVTTVYMATVGGEEDFKGQYHAHPYGEINCVVPIDEGAELRGLNGWMGKGWTSPHPGSHHYPQCRRGGVVALFFLPAGRISYDAKPEDAMPPGA
ncbi:hypothetical protein FJTKL_12326 [Diaporthe vaccinii]|uniref:p-hydroxylaminobenzoate lyase n=1 Tax=Diaporthe vaccinii TaxID=105482 RepID=A0ABR4EEK2_9PEZI